MNAQTLTTSEVVYHRVLREEASDDLLEECAELFRQHYGRWSTSSKNGSRAGKPIKLPKGRIRQDYLVGDEAWIGTGRTTKGQLIAYAIVSRVKLSHGPASWVTQLVVHTDYQNQLVGSKLLNASWTLSQDYAWGIASANPYAVRALEKATRRICEPTYINDRRPSVEKIIKNIPYLRDKSLCLTAHRSVIDTQYFQDLHRLEEMLENASKKTGWIMGQLDEGQEWLAVTFRQQPARRLAHHEFEAFMQQSDAIVREAYERMSQANPEATHKWARPEHAEREVDYLVQAMQLKPGARILDFGCGAGRHSLALARRGYVVVGVDFSKSSVALAREKTPENVSAKFYDDDCRTVRLDEKFDAGICLYDVVGSFPDDRSNELIVENLGRHLKPGAPVAVSAMSYELADISLTKKVPTREIQTALSELEASNTMESTGDIFDAEFVLIDTQTHVAYRKESFDKGSSLPNEMIVRDRRFTKEELKALLQKLSFDVAKCGHVRAGNFQLLEQESAPTKEILAIARKALV